MKRLKRIVLKILTPFIVVGNFILSIFSKDDFEDVGSPPDDWYRERNEKE